MSTCINRTVRLEIEIGIHVRDLPLVEDIPARHLLAIYVARGKLKARLRVFLQGRRGRGAGSWRKFSFAL